MSYGSCSVVVWLLEFLPISVPFSSLHDCACSRFVATASTPPVTVGLLNCLIYAIATCGQAWLTCIHATCGQACLYTPPVVGLAYSPLQHTGCGQVCFYTAYLYTPSICVWACLYTPAVAAKLAFSVLLAYTTAFVCIPAISCRLAY